MINQAPRRYSRDSVSRDCGKDQFYYRAVLVAEAALKAVGWSVSHDAVRQTASGTHDPQSKLAKAVMAFVERDKGAKGGKPLVISAALDSSCVCAPC